MPPRQPRLSAHAAVAVAAVAGTAAAAVSLAGAGFVARPVSIGVDIGGAPGAVGRAVVADAIGIRIGEAIIQVGKRKFVKLA